MKAEGKVFVVTGAGSGIGRELTLSLLSRGASVAGVDIHGSTLEETKALAKQNASKLKTYVADISSRQRVVELYEAVIKDFTSVDGLINNAGIIQPFVKFNDLSYADIERVMNVNFYGTINMTKTFLPHLITRPVAHVVNISSMGGFLPVPGQTVYGASKAAVKLFTEGLHSEMSGTNVRVTVVFPGAIATNITENSGLAMPASTSKASSDFEALPAPEAATIIIEGMENDKFRVLVGKDARFMDKISRLNPRRAAAFIADKMKALLEIKS